MYRSHAILGGEAAGLIFQEVEFHSYIVYYGDRMYARGNRLPGAALPLLMKMHSRTSLLSPSPLLPLHAISAPRIRSQVLYVSRSPLFLGPPVVTLQRRSTRGECRTHAAHRGCCRRTVVPPSFPDHSASVAPWRTHPPDREHRAPTYTRLYPSRGRNSANRNSSILFPLSRQSTCE